MQNHGRDKVWHVNFLHVMCVTLLSKLGTSYHVLAIIISVFLK